MASLASLARRARRRRLSRATDDLIEAVCLVARHQGELAAGVGEERRRLERRSAVVEMRYRELAARIERVERGLGHLEEALPRRNARIAILRDQLASLRTAAARHGEPDERVSRPARLVSRPARLGSALIYAGCLVLVWLVLWQLGLAFGLR